MARGPPTATALLLLHEAAQAFRGLVPQLGGNQAAIATQLLNAVDHALTGAEQTLEVGDSQETVPALQCEPSEVVGDTVNAQTEPDTIQPVQHTVEATATNAQQAGEPTDFSLGSDMPGTETEDEAFGLDRRRRTPASRGDPPPTTWTALVGITPSQAAPYITESLEADVRALGVPTQDTQADTATAPGGGAAELPPTLPWAEQWHTQHGGSSTDTEPYYQNEPSEASEGDSHSADSHRRRRLHAAGLD